jgi:hypothetical protein
MAEPRRPKFVFDKLKIEAVITYVKISRFPQILFLDSF